MRLQYAAADVCHLFELHDVLADRLRGLGRLTWVEEECERLTEVRFTPQDLAATVLALPESRKMDSRQRAVLLALYRFREEQARRLDRPPSHVLPPAALAQVAADPSARLEAHGSLTPRQATALRQGHPRGGAGGAERAAARAAGPNVAGAGQADAGADEEAGRAEGMAAGAGEGARHRGRAYMADAQHRPSGARAAVVRRGAALAGRARMAAGAVRGVAAARGWEVALRQAQGERRCAATLDAPCAVDAMPTLKAFR